MPTARPTQPRSACSQASSGTSPTCSAKRRHEEHLDVAPCSNSSRLGRNAEAVFEPPESKSMKTSHVIVAIGLVAAFGITASSTTAQQVLTPAAAAKADNGVPP